MCRRLDPCLPPNRRSSDKRYVSTASGTAVCSSSPFFLPCRLNSRGRCLVADSHTRCVHGDRRTTPSKQDPQLTRKLGEKETLPLWRAVLSIARKSAALTLALFGGFDREHVFVGHFICYFAGALVNANSMRVCVAGMNNRPFAASIEEFGENARGHDCGRYREDERERELRALYLHMPAPP